MKSLPHPRSHPASDVCVCFIICAQTLPGTHVTFGNHFVTFIQAMQTARLELKLSQKDVAQKINEKPSVLQDYESGKAIPNPQILAKLERALGVKLRGMFP